MLLKTKTVVALLQVASLCIASMAYQLPTLVLIPGVDPTRVVETADIILTIGQFEKLKLVIATDPLIKLSPVSSDEARKALERLKLSPSSNPTPLPLTHLPRRTVVISGLREEFPGTFTLTLDELLDPLVAIPKALEFLGIGEVVFRRSFKPSSPVFVKNADTNEYIVISTFPTGFTVLQDGKVRTAYPLHAGNTFIYSISNITGDFQITSDRSTEAALIQISRTTVKAWLFAFLAPFVILGMLLFKAWKAPTIVIIRPPYSPRKFKVWRKTILQGPLISPSFTPGPALEIQRRGGALFLRCLSEDVTLRFRGEEMKGPLVVRRGDEVEVGQAILRII